ncbi:hypothetical protein P9112_002220 [Eukaryota sp. TZLM1-RC]
MIGSRDRDDRRRDRPERPYFDAAALKDADKLLKFVNKFILSSRTDRVLRKTRVNIEDPAQVALANEVASLRDELERAREGSQTSDEYFENITSEHVHEWTCSVKSCESALETSLNVSLQKYLMLPDFKVPT